MNNWQEWVVGVLIVLCIARVIYGIYLFFRRTRESENPCDSCVSGCDLKDMMEKKRQECGVKKKSTKKNCCGQLVVSKFVLPLQPQTRKNGSLDEWLSQRSAKPCTAVRIRQEPHEALSDVFWKGFSLLLTENGTTLVLQSQSRRNGTLLLTRVMTVKKSSCLFSSPFYSIRKIRIFENFFRTCVMTGENLCSISVPNNGIRKFGSNNFHYCN